MCFSDCGKDVVFFMKTDDVSFFRCPACHSPLVVTAVRPDHNDWLENGTLACQDCHAEYPVIEGIPRFVALKNYADSFGVEWHSRARTQMDTMWQELYRERFYATTEFADRLAGQTLLEVGCGAGAFTGIALATGARLFSCDLSNAVEVCRENHAEAYRTGSVVLSQADIYALPFPRGIFDKIFCLGVLQHTPDPKAAFLNLARYLRPGGELVVDCYQKQTFPNIQIIHFLKHLVRGVTKYLPPTVLFRFCHVFIATAYNLKAKINTMPVVGHYLHELIPIGKLQRFDWTPEYMKELKSLNVFDMLSPQYDQPQSVTSVRSWIDEAGLECQKCTTGFNGVNAKARRAGEPVSTLPAKS
jgi:SAM-dependent methyltransferase